MGDWGAHIWSEECKDFPIIRMDNDKKQCTSGCWSTQRCSLFFTGGKDGKLEFWDLLLDFKKPIYIVDTQYPILCVAISEDGKYVSCGLVNGDFKVYEVDEAFQHCTAKEKMLTTAMFERELQRLKNLDGRLREIILREKALQKAMKENEKVKKKNLDGEEEEELEEEEEELVEAMGEEFEGEEDEYIDPDPVLTAATKNFYDLSEQIRIKRNSSIVLIAYLKARESFLSDFFPSKLYTENDYYLPSHLQPLHICKLADDEIDDKSTILREERTYDKKGESFDNKKYELVTVLELKLAFQLEVDFLPRNLKNKSWAFIAKYEFITVPGMRIGEHSCMIPSPSGKLRK
uniref:Uncharacterized protein n=1 Tax=Megaselia scalaris TaxID=36166 RepID=T1GV94_MEGSC